ncbi:glycosyltransferase family 4 protein [Rufibacter quisquiliarum]|uniref:Glycosyltransferase involved in cell wall biosynthesis n=1 Tax=Rufibacter quisquiliarum TaxID=1549639 RepID=A0A839GS66_9BACT|nr:glycosyltransferase family 4 protein [Rufibacter quisquiliarum]MBA9076671.1 glycosyltransferase involved in cell wall biosynthesis [Rufibacter quisquiliarum]
MSNMVSDESPEGTCLHYVGFGETTGYGVAAKTLVQALRKTGTTVFFTQVQAGPPEDGGVVLTSDLPPAARCRYTIVHTVPEYYPYWVRKEKEATPPQSVWGYTTWETDRLPSHWPALLNQMDGIMVTSHWNRQVFAQCGVTVPILVLPHVSEFEGKAGSDSEPSQTLHSLFRAAKGHFLFYSIGVWNERKAPWVLIKAFQEEFKPDEKVALLLKTGVEDWTSPCKRRWDRLFRKRFGRAAVALRKCSEKGGAKVFHLDQELSNQAMARLHTRGDCFVSLTRGEGWGMGAYEAAWFGKPVIMTAYGGALDYLPEEHAYLVPYELVAVKTSFGQESYSSNQRWAEVEVQKAREVLRDVFENRQKASEKGAKLQRHLQENFSATAIAHRCLQILSGAEQHAVGYAEGEKSNNSRE